MPSDEQYLQQAIRLAMTGRGQVEPNPMVGCVIVKNDRIIGQGFHEKFGGPHAEPNALASCTQSPQGATAYVTLEPCCHLDKKNPPCVPKLIAAKIARVVIGTLDPNPKVNGNGVRQLRQAGISIDGPLLEAECKQLIAPFLASQNLRRPYVTLKWAQSANGKVAGRLGHPIHITNSASDQKVHELRAHCDAIAVGTNTVRNDDPLLTARGVPSHRPLLRVILSNSLKIAPTSRLVQTAKQHPLLIYCSAASAAGQPQHVDELIRAGAQVIPLPDAGTDRFAFPDMLKDLHDKSVTHLLIEPGPKLAKFLITSGLADRIWIFRSPVPISDEDGLTAATVDYPISGELNLDGDRLTEYLNPVSQVFFAPVPSADFVLAAEHK
jgi:diaminohydroxyphosphoribosylaminopyrimidine deaminase/5-amino-6-(5-phosphoribosylamino)uracil reductase